MIIIHDLPKESWETLPPAPKEAQIIAGNGTIKKCIGCFGCWVKTPGQCVIADDYQKMGELYGNTDEIVIISRCCFGSYSSFVKNVLDRSISYVLPYFEIRKGEMHHKSRYGNKLRIRAYFYGKDITEQEKKTAGELVEANALNFNGEVEKVLFVENEKELLEVITW